MMYTDIASLQRAHADSPKSKLDHFVLFHPISSNTHTPLKKVESVDVSQQTIKLMQESIGDMNPLLNGELSRISPFREQSLMDSIESRRVFITLLEHPKGGVRITPFCLSRKKGDLSCILMHSNITVKEVDWYGKIFRQYTRVIADMSGLKPLHLTYILCSIK